MIIHEISLLFGEFTNIFNRKYLPDITGTLFKLICLLFQWKKNFVDINCLMILTFKSMGYRSWKL